MDVSAVIINLKNSKNGKTNYAPDVVSSTTVRITRIVLASYLLRTHFASLLGAILIILLFTLYAYSCRATDAH